jgi:hypothetical protein
MRSGLTVSRHDQLQHRSAAIIEGRLRDERLGRVGKGTANLDSPVPLDAGHECPKGTEPSLLTNGERLVANNWDLDHAATLTGRDQPRA